MVVSYSQKNVKEHKFFFQSATVLQQNTTFCIVSEQDLD